MSKEGFFIFRVGRINGNGATISIGQSISKEVFSQLPDGVEEIYRDGLVGIIIDHTGQVFIHSNNKEKQMRC